MRTVDAYLAHLEFRGFSDKTVRRRCSVLTRFRNWIEPLTLSEVTPELIEEWVAAFTSPATRHAYRSDIATFYEWARKRKLVKVNPAEATDAIKVPRTLPRPLPTDVVDHILDTCHDPTVRLWCALGLFAGLRCNEIAMLARDDVTLHGDAPTLVVRGGKGGKDRVIPLHPRLIEMLGHYKRGGRLFDVDGDTVGRFGSAHLRSCGLDATMHQLRHTFATELARASGGNVVLVAYLLGHGSLATTMRYIGWAGGANTIIVASMYEPGTKPLS